MSLRKKTLSGVAWTFGQQVGVQSINFIIQIILARLLLPEAFGLIAMIQIFMAIGQTLMDGGMTSSLIRTKDPDQADYSTVFFINLFASIGLYVLLFFAAPFIASFFNQELLTLIIRVYTLSFVIQALVGVQTTRLTKEMNFKLQMYMQIPSTLLGGIVGVVLAYKGYGVWSLVWMQLTVSFLFMLQHWFRTDWRPSFIIDGEKFKFHFIFGYKLTFSALLTAVYTNSYTLVIAKMFSAAQLGFYNQANTLRMYPVRNLTVALQKVTYPLFSSIQDDDLKLKRVFKKITQVVFYIIYPVMLVLILIAEPLFRFILTEKWLPAVPYFQILCIAAIVYPLSMYNLNIILAKGRSDLHFKLEVLKKGGSVLFLLLIIPFGIWGAVYASAISMFIHAFVNSYYSGRLIGYPLAEQIKDLFSIIIIGLFSFVLTLGILVFLLNNIIKHDFLLVAIVSILLLFSYILVSFIFNIQSLKEIISLIKKVLRKVKSI